MGYKVDYTALQELMGAYNGVVGNWSNGISSVIQKELAIEASTNISGNKASNMKQYLATTYSCAKDSLVLLLELFRQNYLLYTEAYHQQIDPAGDTHIDSEELSRLRSSLQGKRGSFQQLAVNAESTVGKVSDLISLPGLDISEPDTRIGSILTSLDDLDTAINALESAHVSADFTEIDEMISKLDAYLLEMIGQSKEFKTGFSPASFLALASVPGLITSMYDAYDRLSAQESDVSLAVTNLENRLEQKHQEMEKRQKQAKWAKAAVGIVATLAVAACVATGVGTLLVPVVCGVGKCAFNAAADEYVTHGWDTDKWDGAYIGKESIKGWFSGFTGAILPPGTGEVVKASLSSANSALWGGLDNAYDQLVATGTISDTKSIFFDAEKSGVSSFAGDLVGNAISDKLEDMPTGLGLDKYTNPSNDIRHYIQKFVAGGVDKVSSGIGERFVSTSVEIAYDTVRNHRHGEYALNGIEIADRYSGVASLEEITADFVKGGSKEVVSSYIKERTPDPNTGLTPIIQAKLGYETDLATGLTGVVQESLSHIVDEDQFSDILREMEERDPSGIANSFISRGESGEAGKSLDTLGQKAIRDAWANEVELVRQGKGTRDWTVSQQEELLRTGKVSGFEGQHMMDKSNHPEYAGDKNNIQFLTYEEHFYGAHEGNFRNKTDGRYDPATGEMHPFISGEAPTQKAIDLTDTIDPDHIDVLSDLGHNFGYGRGQDTALSRERHKGEKSNGSIT